MPTVLRFSHRLVWDDLEWFGFPFKEARTSYFPLDARENALIELMLEKIVLLDPVQFLGTRSRSPNYLYVNLQHRRPEMIRLGFEFARAFKQLNIWPQCLSEKGVASLICMGAHVKITPGEYSYLRLKPDKDGRIVYEWRWSRLLKSDRVPLIPAWTAN